MSHSAQIPHYQRQMWCKYMCVNRSRFKRTHSHRKWNIDNLIGWMLFLDRLNENCFRKVDLRKQNVGSLSPALPALFRTSAHFQRGTSWDKTRLFRPTTKPHSDRLFETIQDVLHHVYSLSRRCQAKWNGWSSIRNTQNRVKHVYTMVISYKKPSRTN